MSEDLASANLVLGASHSVLARDGNELLDLLRGGQGVFNVIPLSGVVEDVDAGILEFGAEPEAPVPPQRRPRTEGSGPESGHPGPLAEAR